MPGAHLVLLLEKFRCIRLRLLPSSVVNNRGADLFVPQHFLHNRQIHTFLEQVSCGGSTAERLLLRLSSAE